MPNRLFLPHSAPCDNHSNNKVTAYHGTCDKQLFADGYICY